MPEICPHCQEAITSVRREPEDGRPFEVWKCENCDEEWRHPQETILNNNLDFSESQDQITRRNTDADLEW